MSDTDWIVPGAEVVVYTPTDPTPPTPDIVVSRDAAGQVDGLLCPDCRMDTIWNRARGLSPSGDGGIACSSYPALQYTSGGEAVVQVPAATDQPSDRRPWRDA